MIRRNIHSTDIAVSSLGLGTVKFGRNQQVKYPSSFDLPEDNEILSLLDLAQELGINFLDTAPAYGTSEERIGQLLGERRDDWAIMSKAGEEFVNGESHYDFSKAAITASVERTLSRLRTDRIESLLIHSDGNDLEILDHSDAVATLFQLKEAGKVRSIGISTKTVAGGQRAIEIGLDSVMVMYNPWEQEEEPVLDTAVQSGTTIFIKKALGSGWFGDEEDEDPVETAFRFIFKKQSASSVIVGTLNPGHLRQNATAMARIESD
tara:strand:+ start:3367 stop:4158 length:792 start_codon:yes stop_codon:yes gene_type:complete